MNKRKVIRRKKNPGVYMYCPEELKKRIDRARRLTNRTLTGYLQEAVERQLERDEAEFQKRGL